MTTSTSSQEPASADRRLKLVALRACGYAAAGFFLTLLNPFGSVTGVPLAPSAAFWIGLTMFGGLVGELFIPPLFARLPQLGPVCVTILSAGTFCIFITPALALARWLLLRETTSASDWPRQAFFVLLISAPMTAASILIRRNRTPASPSAALDEVTSPSAPNASPSARLRSRLSLRLRTATIWAVEAEDHYLRVHTSAGNELVLMRLADALVELADVDGVQTHRSWWVARDGLADAERRDGRLVLKLKTGGEAPVSRTYQQAVRAWAAAPGPTSPSRAP